MKKHNQLNLHQRYQIETLLEKEISKSEITKIIRVALCSIYRELRFEKWSPEFIMKRLELKTVKCVSHKTIHLWIWNTKKCKQTGSRW